MAFQGGVTSTRGPGQRLSVPLNLCVSGVPGPSDQRELAYVDVAWARGVLNQHTIKNFSSIYIVFYIETDNQILKEKQQPS